MHCLTVIYPTPDDEAHFKKYYKETHIPLAKQLPGLKSCHYAYPAAIGPADNVPFCIFQAFFECPRRWERRCSRRSARKSQQTCRITLRKARPSSISHQTIRNDHVQETTRYNLTIGGKSVPTQDHFEVRNPSTGDVIGLAPKATAADLDAAVDAAQTAFASWSKTSHEERQKLLPRRGAEAHRQCRGNRAPDHARTGQAAQRPRLALRDGRRRRLGALHRRRSICR